MFLLEAEETKREELLARAEGVRDDIDDEADDGGWGDDDDDDGKPERKLTNTLFVIIIIVCYGKVRTLYFTNLIYIIIVK